MSTQEAHKEDTGASPYQSASGCGLLHNLGGGTFLSSREIPQEGLSGELSACNPLGGLENKCLGSEERSAKAQEVPLLIDIV